MRKEYLFDYSLWIKSISDFQKEEQNFRDRKLSNFRISIFNFSVHLFSLKTFESNEIERNEERDKRLARNAIKIRRVRADRMEMQTEKKKYEE